MNYAVELSFLKFNCTFRVAINENESSLDWGKILEETIIFATSSAALVRTVFARTFAAEAKKVLFFISTDFYQRINVYIHVFWYSYFASIYKLDCRKWLMAK